MIDHWGYYNGQNNEKGMFPTMIKFEYGYTKLPNFNSTKPVPRQSDEESCKIGMIKKIIYPTGGGSNFYYDGHKDVNNELHKNGNFEIIRSNEQISKMTIGGVRIRTIEDFDEKGKIVNKREFEYPQGILIHYPLYLKSLKTIQNNYTQAEW